MRDRLLLALALLLLRTLSPVGRVDALLRLNRLVDLDLEAELERMEKPGEGPLAGETEDTYAQVPAYSTE